MLRWLLSIIASRSTERLPRWLEGRVLSLAAGIPGRRRGPRRHASFHWLEDDGVGLTPSTSAEKKYGARTSTPAPMRKRDSGDRTTGWVNDRDVKGSASAEPPSGRGTGLRR